MLPLLLLPTFTALFATTYANHADCTWGGPGLGFPESYGYTLWGTGQPKQIQYFDKKTGQSVTAIEYLAHDRSFKKLADWNVLAASTLEFATPCNGGGYARESECDSYPYWAVCISEKYNIKDGAFSCKYLSEWDDCAWIEKFNISQAPKYVHSFYGQSM